MGIAEIIITLLGDMLQKGAMPQGALPPGLAKASRYHAIDICAVFMDNGNNYPREIEAGLLSRAPGKMR